MQTSSLHQAVAAFAQATAGLSDADLERDYTWRYHDEGLRFALIGAYHELRDLAATLAAERAADGPPVTTAPRVLAQYHAAYRDLQAALIGVGHDDAQRAPAEGEWPIWLTLAHMIMTEQNFFPRIAHAVERARAGQPPAAMTDAERQDYLARDAATDSTRLLWFIYGDVVASWEQAQETPPPAAMSGRFDELLAYYDAVHDRVVHELAPLSDADLAAPSLWGEDDEVLVRYRLHRFDAHLRQHTIQVDKTLVALGLAPTESKRLLRLIYAALAEAEGAAIGALGIASNAQAAVAAAIAARAEEVAGLVGSYHVQYCAVCFVRSVN
jgi:hypothetical protein